VRAGAFSFLAVAVTLRECPPKQVCLPLGASLLYGRTSTVGGTTVIETGASHGELTARVQRGTTGTGCGAAETRTVDNRAAETRTVKAVEGQGGTIKARAV